MNEPLNYQAQAFIDHFNMQPSEVKGRSNADCETQKRYLYTKLYSVFRFTLPESWDENYFRFMLFHYGSIGVIYTNEYGWVAQPYSIEKLNLYYNPAIIKVYNAFIDEPKTGVVGFNAEIIRLMDDYYGLDDIVTKYAVMLAQIDKSININLMNCNVSSVFEAESKKQAEEIKTAFGLATEGNPLVVINKDVMQGKKLETLFPSVSTNYIVDKLLTARRGIVNQFLTEIGIKNANYEKKERLNSQEVGENDDETRAIVSVIKDNLVACLDKVNKISDLGLKVELRYDYEKPEETEVDDNGEI